MSGEQVRAVPKGILRRKHYGPIANEFETICADSITWGKFQGPFHPLFSEGRSDYSNYLNELQGFPSARRAPA